MSANVPSAMAADATNPALRIVDCEACLFGQADWRDAIGSK